MARPRRVEPDAASFTDVDVCRAVVCGANRWWTIGRGQRPAGLVDLNLSGMDPVEAFALVERLAPEAIEAGWVEAQRSGRPPELEAIRAAAPAHLRRDRWWERLGSGA